MSVSEISATANTQEVNGFFFVVMKLVENKSLIRSSTDVTVSSLHLYTFCLNNVFGSGGT